LKYNIKTQITINYLDRISSGNAWRCRDASIGESKSNLAPPSPIIAMKMEVLRGRPGGLRCLYLIRGPLSTPKTTDTTIKWAERTCGAGR
jgi:hypothetical protein